MAQKTKRLSRLSQSIEFSPPKAQLSALEKDVQEIIDGIGKFLESHKTKQSDSTSADISMDKRLNTLRQHMRTVRRWRNGSLPYGPADCDVLTDDLIKTYRELVTMKAKDLSGELKHIDEFILILDEDSNNLRKNMDDDIQNMQKQIANFSSEGTESKSKGSSEKSALDKLKETDTSIKELQQAVNHLHLKIQENNEALGANLSIQTSSKSTSTSSEDSPKSFELNAARNRVLATADNIRQILRSLKAGCHLPMGSTNQVQIQNCADNDIEVLRRQLRKVRRWQQSLEVFYDEDVDDLHLIVSAIERHVGDKKDKTADNRSNSTPPTEATIATTEKRPSRKEQSNTSSSTTSAKSISSSDTDSYTGPPSTDSEAPPSYEDVCHAQITVKITPDENVEGDLDENVEFSERLI